MLDFVIIGIYCLVTVFLGVTASRGIRTLRDYALGGQSFQTIIIIATIAATEIGGETAFGIAEQAHKVGVIIFFVFSGHVICQFLISKFLAGNIEPFYGKLSLAEIMEEQTGLCGRVITGLIIFVSSMSWVVLQIVVFGSTAHQFLGLDQFKASIAGAIIILVYSLGGGIRAVVRTDVFQFMILIIAIPLACSVGLGQVGGYQALFEQLPNSHLSFDFSSQEWIRYGMLFLTYSFLGCAYPAYLQRLMLTKDRKQAVQSVSINAWISIPLFAVLTLCGLITFVVAPDIPGRESMPYIINNYLPAGIRGLAIAGLLAVIMSTADSLLNVGSLSFIHDVIKPLLKKGFAKTLKDRTELILVKLAMVLGMIFAVYLAFDDRSILDIGLKAHLFWGVNIFPPMVAIIMRRQLSMRVFIMGIIIGNIFLWTWYANYKEAFQIDGILPGFLSHLIFLFLFTKKRKV